MNAGVSMKRLVEWLYSDRVMSEVGKISELCYENIEGWEENATLSNKRKLEFAAGRKLAKKVLRRCKIWGHVLKVGKDKLPAWPSGIVGCISHSGDYCGVVVAHAKDYTALGFDIENIEKIKPFY
jgi:4'-phosphopantetheinyl transferase EntD